MLFCSALEWTCAGEQVWRSLNRINPRKAPGPDGIPGRALKDPAPLGFGLPVFRDLFGLIRGQYVDREGSVGRRRHPPLDKRSAADEVRYIGQEGGKASTSGDKGSCSGQVDEQNRLEQETSAATASQLHRQLAKPGQEAGTAAAAGQVARQPERELATAPAVTDTRSKTRNREEEENPDMVVMWGVLDN
ncbi:unnamed protein product [Pleuronectes platessa]|uniref:Uncharacterized protein n=1 Tax=Pleuronectes platessa TaxID=8262 RepID=A0A9N7V1J0_PLEPL|nr:unnamed protein product [Pleuronectes platessa]